MAYTNTIYIIMKKVNFENLLTKIRATLDSHLYKMLRSAEIFTDDDVVQISFDEIKWNPRSHPSTQKLVTELQEIKDFNFLRVGENTFVPNAPEDVEFIVNNEDFTPYAEYVSVLGTILYDILPKKYILPAKMNSVVMLLENPEYVENVDEEEEEEKE